VVWWLRMCLDGFWLRTAAALPCPGLAGSDSFALRANDARLTTWPAALCAVPCGRQIATPVTRHARSRAAMQFEVLAVARPPRHSHSLGVTSAAEPPLLVSFGRLRAAAPPGGCSPCASHPTASPQLRPRHGV